MIEDELESIVLSRAWDAFNGYGLDVEEDDKEVTLVKHIDIGEGVQARFHLIQLRLDLPD